VEDFEPAYQALTPPPWDIGRPQPAFIELEQARRIGHSVLDAGCGTGELVLYFALRGHEAWGVDGAATALERARAKARMRHLDATFRHLDALDLPGLGRTFDSVTDSGLFHVFSDAERPRYVESVRRVLRPEGTYHVLCFSDGEPPGWGPRRVSKAELREAFADGWREVEIVPHAFGTNLGRQGAKAWRASFVRLP